MWYRILADIVFSIHFAFVIFVILGGLFVLRWRWTIWLHLPALGWGVLIQLFGWICPLTPLENHLRVLAGQEGYTGGFIEHYITSVLYPAGLTREMQIMLGLTLLVLNLLVYGYLYYRSRQAGEEQAAEPVAREH